HEKNGDKNQRFRLSKVPSGISQIVTALNDKSVVDLNVSNGDVTLYSNHGGVNQRWRFEYIQNKGYQILSE
ncbi:hypothetical protein COD78_32710, partial [Bacillus cereus]|uniref:RICIN domain-containing protein n=1 Tax=Bacillus cereus TaxID=1396 RepID=UPI000BFAE0DE